MSSTQLLFNPITGLFDLVTKPAASVEDLSDRVDTLEAKYVRTTRFTEVGSGTSGQSTVAFGSTIVLDDFGGGVDALVTDISGGLPVYEHVYTAQGELITAEFDALGNYTLSGTPAAYPVALVYRVRTPLIHFDDTDSDITGATDLEDSKWERRNITSANSPFSPESVNNVIYAVDLTGGSVIINLPAVSASIEGQSCIIYIEKSGTGNYLDVICNGTQTIRGATSQRLTTVRDGFTLIAHTYLTDHWDTPDWAKPIKGDTQIEGLTIEGPIQSATIAEVIQEIGHSMASTGRSGILEWFGSGNYWSWTPGNPGTFTLLRGGEGYIAHKEVIFNAGQTIQMAYGEAAYLFIDSDGVLQKSYTNTRSDILSRIQIGFLQNDINGVEFFYRNDHKFDTDTGSRAWMQRGFGAAFESIAGASVISRYTTGTGGDTTDRMVNLSSGVLVDADLETAWSAFTTGTVTNHTYFNGTNFARYSQSAQYPPVYNNAGTPTDIPSGNRGVFRLFATLDSLNSSSPQFISEMHTAQFGTLGQAQTAIGNGTISNLGGLNKDLAQLGFVVVRNNASGGYVEYVEPQRKTFAQVIGGSGVASTASNVLTDVTAFNGALSAANTTVQSSLDVLDDAVLTNTAQTITAVKTFATSDNSFLSQIVATNPSTGTASGVCIELADDADKLKLCLGNTENTGNDGMVTLNSYGGVSVEGSRDLRLRAPSTRVIGFSIGNVDMGRFYVGSGSIPRFGIGPGTPACNLHVHTSGFVTCTMKLTNGYTSANATDGTDLVVGTDKSTKLWSWEDSFMAFATNNTERMRILSTGEVGIGTTTPKAKLHVSGGVKIEDDTATASADKVGTLRYRATASASFIEVCVQTGETTYEWIVIETRTW